MKNISLFFIIIITYSQISFHCALAAWDVSLIIEQDVEGAIGGEAFAKQPMISVFDLKGTTKHTDLVGRIIATLQHRYYEHSLRNEILGIETLDGACHVDDNVELSVDLSNGDASFTGLCVNTAAEGYRIRYTLKDEFDITLSYLIGEEFQVSIGSPYQIGVIQSTSLAFGGVAWETKSIVAVQDRGRNTIPSFNQGSVVISLANNAGGEKLMFEDDCPSSIGWDCPSSVGIYEGLASFEGTFINKVGLYRLNFTTELGLPGQNYCLSSPIVVEVGRAQKLLVLDEPNARVYGGKTFEIQPRLLIVDHGGNVVDIDSTSRVYISLESNPYNASLAPLSSRIATSFHGIVQFKHLSINQAGLGYRFSYKLFQADEEENKFIDANITTIGSFFNVGIGVPNRIVLSTVPSSTMWAGNQPFLQQPVVRLVDAGGNTVDESERCGTMDAILVKSLSQTSEVIIDTLNDDIPVIDSLQYAEAHMTDGFTEYSAEHIVTIIVSFTQEVTVVPRQDNSNLMKIPPSIELSVVDEFGVRSEAHLNETDLKPSRNLTFTYIVSRGPTTSSINIFSRSSFKLNDYLVVDAWNRNVTTFLPPLNSTRCLLASKNLTVNSVPAVIVAVTTNVESSEYGSGHLIDFLLKFNRRVAVTNYPTISINVKSLIAVIDVGKLGTSYSKSYFYLRYKNERSMSIPWNASAEQVKQTLENMSVVSSSVCVSRSLTNLGYGYRWAIRFDDLHDDFNYGFSVVTATVYNDHNASDISVWIVNTNTPIVDWNTNDGDSSMCTERYANYSSGSGTDTLTFTYEVLPGDNVTKLEFTKLNAVVNVNSLARISNAIQNYQPSSVDVDLDAPSDFGKDISIDTSAPLIVSASFVGQAPVASKYHVGDKLYFSFQFNKNVAVEGDVFFYLNVGRIDNTASYYSGSGTNTILFQYIVQKDHWSQALINDSQQSSIITTHGFIRRNSRNPSTNAELLLPSPPGSLFLQNSTSIQVDGRIPVVKDVFLSSNQSLIFKERETILISVKFSSEVIFIGGPPVAAVSLGGYLKEARYHSGNRSKVFNFEYTVAIGDNISTPSSSFACQMICIASGCVQGVSHEGYIKQYSSNSSLDVDLRLPYPKNATKGNHLLSIYSRSGDLTVNTTGAPQTKIISISTMFEDHQVVSVGEVIRIQVTFSDVVLIPGNKAKPKLQLNVNSIAMYEAGTGTPTLTFRFIASTYDVTDSLDWSLVPGKATPIDCENNGCDIVNENDVMVDLNVIDDIGLPTVGQLYPQLEIDATHPSIQSLIFHTDVPTICSISSCTLTAGDEILFFVRFDSPVRIFGTRSPKIRLNVHVNNNNSTIVYAIYEETLSNETDIAFKLDIIEGQSTNGQPLRIICDVLPCDIFFNDNDAIYRKATFPHLTANTTLPSSETAIIENKEGGKFFIDAVTVPKVLHVNSQNGTGTFSPGDIILIDVIFDSPVHVVGNPALLLDVGSGQIAIAYYQSGSLSDRLVFKYIVESNHCVPKLDYLDEFSLKANVDYWNYGISSASMVTRASANPVMKANLKLPKPGHQGSLSDTCNIQLDCRIPHIVHVWSPQIPGKYSTGDSITINVKFSRQVFVIGNPKILLETGNIDRYAYYRLQPNQTTLEFEYRIQLGDITDDLDYWADESLLRSSSLSFDLNGGTIMLPATLPTIHADTHLNPSYGYLGGESNVFLKKGLAKYQGLKIGKRGKDYKIRFKYFSCEANASFETSSVMSIDDSSEYHVHGDEFNREDGDSFGAAVAIDNKLVAIGAPNKRNPVSEVQVLTVKSDTIINQNEVQLITTELDLVEGTKQIHSFTTSAAANTTISGNFLISYIDHKNYTYAAPVLVPSDASSEQVEALMANSFPNLGPLKVSKIPNVICNCSNAWTWRLTFMDASMGIHEIKTDGSGLKGDNAMISPANLDKNITMLNGQFRLRNPYNDGRSRYISFDADANDMREVLEKDLGYFVKNIMVANMDERDIAQLGRRWTVTFSHFHGQRGMDINVPNLEVFDSQMDGSNALVWTHVPFEGRGTINGTFALSFRKSAYSEYIPYNASEKELEAALESLDSINDVTVIDRKKISPNLSQSGFVWTVVFHSVNRYSKSGWINDIGGESQYGNLSPLEVNDHFTGWNARSIVDYETGYGRGDTQSQWMVKQMGKDGLNSGHVAIYYEQFQQWHVESFLAASDCSSNDHFGHSVSLGGNHIAIGAPTKEVHGDFEIQTLICKTKALGGTFTVSFRGYHSSPIPFDAKLEQLRNAILGVYGSTSKVHPLPDVLIESSWNDPGDGFCKKSGNNITITFITPDASGISTMYKANGDIESLKFDSSNLIGGAISIIESRKGSRILSGNTKVYGAISTLGKKSGVVYVFQRKKDCPFCPHTWIEKIKVSQLDGLDHPENSARFGWSVAIITSKDSKDLTLLIGSPGFNISNGKVYVFTGHGNTFKYETSLTNAYWNSTSSGAEFGHSLAVNVDTLLVSSPGHDSRKGAVFVYTRFSNKTGFLPTQSIYGPPEINEGDEFGHAIAISGNRAVMCAPNHYDRAVSGIAYSREKNLKVRLGSCYVYSRESTYTPFVYVQKLIPTNLGDRNRFGTSVAISGNKIIVGQVEEYIDSTKILLENVRGKAHLFNYYDDKWTEVSYLYPYDPQSHDLFGASVALQKDVAIVGAPNRKLLNIGSGCASLYDLSFANFYFTAKQYSVDEGDALEIPLRRIEASQQQRVGYMSIDRNADPFIQRYITKLFSLSTSLDKYPGKTAVDLLSENIAYGRNNSNEWINGMYDYNGRSDYQSIRSMKLYQPGERDALITLNTTDDQISEYPDESLAVHISLPGMFASNQGNLKVQVTIFDNDDCCHDNFTYYRKLFGSQVLEGDEFGSSSDFVKDPDVMIIGSHKSSKINGTEIMQNVGAAYVYVKSLDRWNQTAILTPFSPDKQQNSFFGQSLCLTKMSHNNDLLAIIGAPGQIRAYVFFYDSLAHIWKKESILVPFNESHVHAEHNFAGRGAVKIYGDVAFVGAPGLEAVFIYKRLLNDTNQVYWHPWQKLRSSDYDYDKYNNGYKTHHVHKQLFGKTLAVNSRLLLVAAPYADFGNRGKRNIGKTDDTGDHYSRGSGKGKVYAFYARPLIVRVQLITSEEATNGQFKFHVKVHQRSPIETSALAFNTESISIKEALESIAHVGEVNVKKATTIEEENQIYSTEWIIAFMTIFHDEVTLLPLWDENGCDLCEPIQGLNNTHINVTMKTEVVSIVGNYTQEVKLQGDDVTSGDRFGYNLDFDGNEAIIGAMHSSSKTRTTWDFETGNLIGWVANGNAFDYQPVFGDNSRKRMVYNGFGKQESKMSGYPQSATIQGRYYIGTYEKRPGNTSYYLEPDSSFSEGSTQGDEPIGTLTSDPFLILGEDISFLIGGGCNHLTEYVELLVDGFATARATGNCNERMDRVKWQVGTFTNRSAQIRIVDMADDEWGHINVDDFRFSWKAMGNNGGCSNSGGALLSHGVGSKQHYSGQEESALSGAAYIFVRNCSSVDWISAQQGIGCTWKQDQRLTPSDKRSGNLFGSSVSINSSRGIALVGSEHAPMYGFYKELSSLYPHYEHTLHFPFDQKLEEFIKSDRTLSPTDGNLRVTNEIISNKEQNDSSRLAEKYHQNAGATYLYVRTKSETAADGTLLRASHWQSFEHVKFTPPDISGHFLFGKNVKIKDESALITATGDKSCCGDSGGAAFVFDMRWYTLKFAQVEYEALEGYHDKVLIKVIREDSTYDNTALTIGYSTSDLSAVGVDSNKFQTCLNLPIEKRIDCGDYEHSSGLLHFLPGILSVVFEIRIVDDYCWERHLKYVQLNLHITGGVVLQGEHYRAQLKIDDDDWISKNTTKIC